MKTSTITDIDGNVYKTVIIGNQEWMAENLRVTRFSDGTQIPHIVDSNDWMNTKTGAYCVYDNNDNFKSKYGLLYNWFAVSSLHGIAPEGFKVPSLDDLIEFYKALGNNPMSGAKLKSSPELWNNKCETTNDFGFNAIPSGNRQYHDGRFTNGETYSYGKIASYWCADEDFGRLGLNIKLDANTNGIHQNWYEFNNGYSVRCLKNI
jgi:uncharacterized protein (TIGR02145 family)